MDFIAENIAFVMSLLTAIFTYVVMTWAKIPVKCLTKLLPFCQNKKIATAVNAGAGLSESCVIASLVISIINLIGGLAITQDWAILAGCLANFAYLFIENIQKAKAGTLTEDDQKKAAEALDKTVDQAQRTI